MSKIHRMKKIKAQNSAGLYIHIPFCQKKCFFCSFAVCVSQGHHVDEYLQALEMEAAAYKGHEIKTVYVGGGTPTFLNLAQLDRLHRIIVSNFNTQHASEWTIETNPDLVDHAKAVLLRRLGFDRISIGAQTAHAPHLKFLGRTHQVKDIPKCFDMLRQTGFFNINLDMMFGFPGQTSRQLSKDISVLTKLGSEHLSIYNLCVERNSLFYRMKLALPDNHQMARFYRNIIEGLAKEGFSQYEVSNFSRPGKESIHNISYWRCENYIGLGMGAHSHLYGKRFWNQGKIYSYLKQMKEKGHAVEGYEFLSPRRRLTEAVLFGLRMNQGVVVDEIQQHFGCALSAKQHKQIKKFIDQGFFEFKDGCLKTTLAGRLVLDELCGYLS